jgi:hypothetical protein
MPSITIAALSRVVDDPEFDPVRNVTCFVEYALQRYEGSGWYEVCSYRDFHYYDTFLIVWTRISRNMCETSMSD